MLGLTKFFNKSNTEPQARNEWTTIKDRLRQIPEIVAPQELRQASQHGNERAVDQRLASQTTVQESAQNDRVFYASAQTAGTKSSKRCSIIPEVSRGERLWDRKNRA